MTASARAAAGPAPSATGNPATGPASHDGERQRSKIYGNLRRAILGVIRDYPGLEDRISEAIRPFEEHPAWND